MKKLKVLSLCDGIASGYEAFRLLNVDVEYHSIEKEEWKRKIADENHEGIVRPCHDVYELKSIGYYDYIIAGPTCKSLSSQGSRTDWNGESKIFFTCVDILRMGLIINPDLKFFFENVHSMKNICRDRITLELGVSPFLGLSALVGGQDRKRYYWFNWNTPTIVDRGIMANDLLDEDGLVLIAFSKSNRNEKDEESIVEGRIKTNGKSATLVTDEGCRGQSTMNLVLTKKMKSRNLTSKECARLQGLENYIFNCSDANIFKAVGDGWSIPMIVEIFRESLVFDV